jgi:hypothetical protein
MPPLTYQRNIIGYHGCDAIVVEKVLAGKARLNVSTNAYDWLGQGIYFWEHGPQRAYEWAIEQSCLEGKKSPTRPSSEPKSISVCASIC